ncbi:hypothetical protein ISF_06569 [Cordyceps fumosorosea ARSEF 2679]|uniref:Uncharacterized protein n=1 Tax=Cordyceps fumosorosea (strain ARSEF 2679) TaxID=1081104 RepID=A0A167RP38_CORFA|nr:hypothetical protein ISF_06569 [Cordyceps fumosorosea ARSEF 2679]OAA58786.1 hypothetical protein ISF_06569 [Cordyceps fumosorosea ARSEF 2679]
MSQLKHEISSSDFEIEAEDRHIVPKIGLLRAVDTLRTGLTLVALASGAAVLGLAAHTLAVYRATSLPAEYLLQLWPEDFDVRPTNSLIACGVLVLVANTLALGMSKVSFVSSRYIARSSVSVTAPGVGLVGALVAMSFFYAVNASTKTDSIQSWSCRWGGVAMDTRPHFGTLCKESKAALTLATLLVPVEALIIGVAGYEAVLLRRINQGLHH